MRPLKRETRDAILLAIAKARSWIEDLASGLNFPWLCHRRREIARSLSPGISVSPKMPPKSLALPNPFPAEFPVASRDRFECRQRPV